MIIPKKRKKSKVLKGSTERQVLYVYASKENKEYIEDIALAYNIRLSLVVNMIIEAYRKRKRIMFKPHEPKFLRKAEQYLEKKAKLERQNLRRPERRA